MAGWVPEKGEILALAAVAAHGIGWHSRGQAALVETPGDTASSSGSPIEAMELDATISVNLIAAVAPPVQVLPVAIMNPEWLH